MSLDVLNLLLVFLAAMGGGWAARRLGAPSILGELLAGVVVGPPLLGILGADDATSVIGKLGVVLLMLYIGLHLDPGSIGKAAKPGALAALGGFLVPAGLGYGLMIWATGDAIAAAFVAVAMGVTSLATKSRILVDLGILNTRIAHVLMAGALFSDVAALVLFSALLAFAATGAVAIGGVAATIGQAVLFFIGVAFVGLVVLPRLARRFLAGRELEPSSLFLGVVALGLAFGEAAHLVGLHEILGAFLAGLFIREGVLTAPQLADVETKARNVSVGLLAPVFFVTAGFQVSFDVFRDELGLLIAVVVLATVGKVIGTAAFYVPSGHGFREGIAVGAGMNGRGAVEIIVAELAYEAGIIDESVFSILVFMAIFTTMTVPVLLTWTVDWLRRRGELATDDRSGHVIVGAGPVGRLLASVLEESGDVVLIDTSAEHVAAAEAEGLSVVRGSATDENVLEAAGVRSASAFVAVTPNSEVNLLAARLAVTWFGVPQTFVALTPDASTAIGREVAAIGGEVLFGEKTDVAAWDIDVQRGAATVETLGDADGGDVLVLAERTGDAISIAGAHSSGDRIGLRRVEEQAEPGPLSVV